MIAAGIIPAIVEAQTMNVAIWIIDSVIRIVAGSYPAVKYVCTVVKNSSNSLLGLEKLLPRLSQQRGWEEQLDLHSIFVRWHELLDNDITDHCQPLKIVKKVLWVEVENSAWLQQLQFQTVLLLDILNKSLRISKLKGLRFCVEAEEKRPVPKEPELSYVQPPAAEIEKFEQQAGGISDPEVRDALIHFWYLSHACRKE